MRYLFFSLLLLIISCSKEQYEPVVPRPPDCDSSMFTFVDDVLPIFNTNCNFEECHKTSGTGSFDFTTYEVVADRIRAGTMEYRLDLPPGDPQHMPEKMTLSACDFFIIKAWIRQGYPEKN